MKTFVKKSRLIPAALFLTMLTAISTDASATAYAKWCTHWLSTYTDAGYGEDVFTSPNPLYRDAKYTHARVERFGSSTPLWEGTLDSSGCVPENLVLLANKKYIFTQWTYAERSNRQIWVNIDTSEFGENAVSFTTTMTTPSSLEDKVYNYTIYPNYDNPKSNLMPIAGRILEKYSTLSMPSGTDTYIHTDSYHCGGGGAYYQGSGEICVLGEQSLSWSDVTTWKFIVAHEIGHRVADANGAPLGGDYSHSGAPYQCRCDYVTHGSQLHCLMSREEGETAQAEGFAHFFAAATFNNRTEDDGKFVYCKDVYGLFGTIIIPPTAWNAYTHSDDDWYDKYMEHNCDPGDVANGIELDWLRFYYEIWTSGGDKFNVGEILDVWDEAGDYGWNNMSNSLLPTVEDIWGKDDPKTTLFKNKAARTGVKHG